MESILKFLNEDQVKAVTSDANHLLVLAGAGSGKTRVLVNRCAWLISQGICTAYNVLALTFTNKAAREMKDRLDTMLPNDKGMWIGTFHSISHRLLSIHNKEADLSDNFQIMDAEDQLGIIKRMLKERAIDDKKYEPRAIASFINKHKENSIRSNNLPVASNPFEQICQEIYIDYEKNCQKSSLVDFAELLLRSYELLKNNPEILNTYQSRFHHILIDEFQDTNTLQYKWIKLLVGDRMDITAVGDDDQSIYSWRGACVENMQKIRTDFPECALIRLEQNYRSTGHILSAANKIINNNVERVGKNLWTDSSNGELISIFEAFNEHDEATFVIEKIRAMVLEQGYSYNEFSILYRSNAQSRVLEKLLLRYDVPYRIFGGQRFYDRAEIKNILAYLRLIFNRNDDTSLERVINLPTRGIGEALMNKVREQARYSGVTLWRAIVSMASSDNNALNSRAKNALVSFVNLLEKCEMQEADSFSQWVEGVIHNSGLYKMYNENKIEISRAENLEEFINACKEYDNEENPLSVFLSNALLDSGDAQAEQGSDYVTMLTLHSSKGLEFPVVFLVGMEEGLFPHEMSINDNSLEEERRLCYVGITRAMKKLFLSYCQTRNFHGKERYNMVSRFLQEIPSELIHSERILPKINNQWFKESIQTHNSGNFYEKEYIEEPRKITITKNSDYKSDALGENHPMKSIGKKVKHPTFGKGIIVNTEGSGQHLRVQVKFSSGQIKWIIASFAGLEYLS